MAFQAAMVGEDLAAAPCRFMGLGYRLDRAGGYLERWTI